jgi:hypothetical protein
VVVEALLMAIYLGDELLLIDIRNPFRSSTCLVRYSWSIPAVSLRIATETRPIRNNILRVAVVLHPPTVEEGGRRREEEAGEHAL